MKRWYLLILSGTVLCCTSEVEQKAYDLCNCYSQVTHTYGKIPPDSSHLTAEQYRTIVWNRCADSCDQLFQKTLGSLGSEEELKEFNVAYTDCRFGE